MHYAARFAGHQLGEWLWLLEQPGGGICIGIQPVMLEDPPEVPDDLSALG